MRLLVLLLVAGSLGSVATAQPAEVPAIPEAPPRTPVTPTLISDATALVLAGVGAALIASGNDYEERVERPGPFAAGAAIAPSMWVPFLVTSPVAHGRSGNRRAIGWTFGLRLVLPAATALLADGIFLDRSLAGMSAGMALGGIVASILDLTLLRERPTHRVKRVLGFTMSALSAIAVAVFLPRLSTFRDSLDSL